MKKLFLIAILGLISIGGCSGSTPVNHLDLDDFIGNWFMEGTMVLNIDGREYTDSFGRTIYIREYGFITDDLGYVYDGKFENQTLTLYRDETFNGHDPYCGFYDAGTTLTIELPEINPFFDQAYTGTIMGDTAVYTQYCNYKPMIIAGTVVMQKLP